MGWAWIPKFTKSDEPKTACEYNTKAIDTPDHVILEQDVRNQRYKIERLEVTVNALLLKLNLDEKTIPPTLIEVSDEVIKEHQYRAEKFIMGHCRRKQAADEHSVLIMKLKEIETDFPEFIDWR